MNRLFGLACEGATDFAVIENILLGLFDPSIDSLEDKISKLQPIYDETTQKQKHGGYGGYLSLLDYLSSSRFEEDLINHQYIIVQIDTDISDKLGIIYPQNKINENQERFIDEFLEKLIEIMNRDRANFYDTYRDKIVFCICVHSIECWLLACHAFESAHKEKLVNCEGTLTHLIQDKRIKNLNKIKELKKEHPVYDAISNVFYKDSNRISEATQCNVSFRLFIDKLSTLKI